MKKHLKIAFLIILLIVGYIAFIKPDASQDFKDRQEWNNYARSAFSKAMSWQKLVNKVDEQDKAEAPIRVAEILKNVPDIQRTDKPASFPSLDPDYLDAYSYVESYYENAKNLKTDQYDLLDFALRNNDTALAEKAFTLLDENRKDLTYIAAAKMGFYYATHSDCVAADRYLKILLPLQNEPDFFMNHTVKPKSGTFSFAEKTIRIWSQTALLCRSLEQSLDILAEYYPMRLTNDQFLLETYVDFAQALQMAGYTEEARRFIALAKNLFETGTFELPHKAKSYIAFFSLLFDSPDQAYRDYMAYVSEYRKDHPDSPILDVAFLQLVADEFAFHGDFEDAFEVTKQTGLSSASGLNLMIEQAHKHLDNEAFKDFLQNYTHKLQNEPPYNRYFQYEPLMKAALYFIGMGKTKEADQLITSAYDYLETGKEATEDKYFKTRAIETLSKYLVFMGRDEEAKMLLEKHPEFKPANVYKGWGALYGYYIDTRHPEKIQELEDNIGTLTVSAAVEYLIYKDNWEEAESLTTERLKEGQKAAEYKTLALRKMGYSFSDTFHQTQQDMFQFGAKSIINAKLCRLFGHCK